MNWTEKYRPSTLREVIGNKAAKETLLKWAKEWQEGEPSKKAAILYGKPGIGKTTSAYALANDFGWEVIELNASDERNREIIRKIALTGAIHEVLSIDGKYVEVINEIAKRCNGDVRSAINDLQSIAYEKKITKNMLSYLGYRDREREIFIGIRNILKAKDIKAAIREAWRIDESPDNLILWIDENLPAEYKHMDDLALAYKFLSKADVFLGRIWRRQYYGLWSYASELMTGGVAVAKQHEYRGFTAYHFPKWLRSMAASRQYRQTKLSIARKIGKAMHCSTKKALEMLPMIEKLFSNDDLAARITAKLDLNEEELSFIVGDRAKEIFKEAEKLKKMKQQAVLFNFK